MRESENVLKIFWGKRAQRRKVWSLHSSGVESGGLSLSHITSLAVRIFIRHVDGRTVQGEGAAAGAAREAADGTSTPEGGQGEREVS